MNEKVSFLISVYLSLLRLCLCLLLPLCVSFLRLSVSAPLSPLILHVSVSLYTVVGMFSGCERDDKKKGER